MESSAMKGLIIVWKFAISLFSNTEISKSLSMNSISASAPIAPASGPLLAELRRFP